MLGVFALEIGEASMTNENNSGAKLQMAPGPINKDRVKALRNSYHHRLLDRIRQIESDWERVRDGEHGHEALISLHRLAHSLAGSAVTFGFDDIGKAANSLEAICIRLLAEYDESAADLPDKISPLIEQIKELANRPVDDFDLEI